jgi:predicted Rossmann fold nucleotide-binding protein DprA/Smf involved in DNA uptake
MAIFWLGVAGSRRRTDRAEAEARIAAEVERLRAEHGRVGILSGGARGPDAWAEELARRSGWPYCVLLPDFEGLAADAPKWAWTRRFHERNGELAEMCGELLAFVSEDGRGGTGVTVRMAERLGKRVTLVAPPATVPRADHAARPLRTREGNGISLAAGRSGG